MRRAVFGGTDADPLKHLGEAQTCHVLLNRSDLAGAWWVSDDGEALRYARHQNLNTYETIDLVGFAVANGDAHDQEGYDLLLEMADRGRRLRLPDSVADLRR